VTPSREPRQGGSYSLTNSVAPEQVSTRASRAPRR
jgi:hypothetical protein